MSVWVHAISSAIITCTRSGEEFAFRLDCLLCPERRSACSIVLPFARLSLEVPSLVLPAAAGGARSFCVSGSPSPPSSIVSWDFRFRFLLLGAPFELECVFADDPSRRVWLIPRVRSVIMLGCMTKPALICHCDLACSSLTVRNEGSNAT